MNPSEDVARESDVMVETVEADVAKPAETAPQKESCGKILMTILVSAMMGIVFGVVFEKSRVFEPRSIRGQMIFRRQIMLKLFLSAVSVSAFVFTMVAVFLPARFKALRELWRQSCDRGVVTAVGGGALLLGAGMAISGACPGMTLSQIGAGVPGSWLTIIGAFVGALTYGLVESHIREPFIKAGPMLPADKRFIDDVVFKGKHVFLLLGVAAGCAGGVVLIEVLAPWDSADELSVPNNAACSVTNPFECRNWPPYIGGAIMALLQVICFFAFNTALGSATAYQSICSTPLLAVGDLTAFSKKHPALAYMAIFTPNRSATLWQVFYCLFAILGAYLSAASPSSPVGFGTVPGLGLGSAFFGGFLLLFGSRMASGCTTGHGLSGMPLLMVHSWIAVPAMFMGGIIVAFIWDAAACSGLPHGSDCFAGPSVGSWFTEAPLNITSP